MSMSVVASQNLVNTDQAAAYLDLKPQTLATWRMTGRYSLPFIRCGGKIKYRVADLDAWLDSRRECGERPNPNAIPVR